MEEAMSLSRKDKEALKQVIIKLAKTINNLENTPIDPRVLDLMEICGSLIEQQIEMDIVFEQCDAHQMQEIILFEPDETDVEDSEVVHIKFEQEDKDIPSAEDLENWFNLGE